VGADQNEKRESIKVQGQASKARRRRGDRVLGTRRQLVFDRGVLEESKKKKKIGSSHS